MANTDPRPEIFSGLPSDDEIAKADLMSLRNIVSMFDRLETLIRAKHKIASDLVARIEQEHQAAQPPNPRGWRQLGGN